MDSSSSCGEAAPAQVGALVPEAMSLAWPATPSGRALPPWSGLVFVRGPELRSPPDAGHCPLLEQQPGPGALRGNAFRPVRCRAGGGWFIARGSARTAWVTVPCLRAAFKYHLIISIPAVHLELLAVSKTTVSFCLRPVSAGARHISKVSRSAEDCRRTTGCAGGGLEERQVGGKPLKPHSKEAGSNNSSMARVTQC